MKLFHLSGLVVTFCLAVQLSTATLSTKKNGDGSYHASNVGKAVSGTAVQAVIDIHDFEETPTGTPSSITAAGDTKHGAEGKTHGTQSFEWENVVFLLRKDGALAQEAAKQGLGEAMKALENIEWNDLQEEVKNYIKAHPTLTAIQLAWLLSSFACPELVVTPVLERLGFGILGPSTREFEHTSIFVSNVANVCLAQRPSPAGVSGSTALLSPFA